MTYKRCDNCGHWFRKKSHSEEYHDEQIFVKTFGKNLPPEPTWLLCRSKCLRLYSALDKDGVKFMEVDRKSVTEPKYVAPLTPNARIYLKGKRKLHKITSLDFGANLGSSNKENRAPRLLSAIDLSLSNSKSNGRPGSLSVAQTLQTSSDSHVSASVTDFLQLNPTCQRLQEVFCDPQLTVYENEDGALTIGPVTRLASLLFGDTLQASNLLTMIDKDNKFKFDPETRTEVPRKTPVSSRHWNSVSAPGLVQMLIRFVNKLPSDIAAVISSLMSGEQDSRLLLLCEELLRLANRPHNAAKLVNQTARSLAALQPRDVNEPVLCQQLVELTRQVGDKVLRPQCVKFAKEVKDEYPKDKLFTYDDQRYRQDGPQIISALVESVSPASQGNDGFPVTPVKTGEPLARATTTAMQVLVTTAVPRHQSPLANLIGKEVYHLSGSRLAVDYLGKTFMGVNVRGSTGHSITPVSEQDVDLSEYEQPFQKPGMIVTDNSSQFDRRVSQPTLENKKAHQDKMLSGYYAFKDEKLGNSDLQQKPLNLKPANTAPLETVLPQPDEILLIKEQREQTATVHLVEALFGLVPRKSSDLQQLCIEAKCNHTDLLPEDAEQCSNCEGRELRTIRDLIEPPAQPAADTPKDKPAAVPQTFDIQLQPLTHDRQKIQVQKDMLLAWLEEAGITGDRAQQWAKWIVVFGDGKTFEFFEKAIAAEKLHGSVINLSGPFHVYMVLQKAVSNLLIKIAGNELPAAAGYKSFGQLKMLEKASAVRKVRTVISIWHAAQLEARATAFVDQLLAGELKSCCTEDLRTFKAEMERSQELVERLQTNAAKNEAGKIRGLRLAQADNKMDDSPDPPDGKQESKRNTKRDVHKDQAKQLQETKETPQNKLLLAELCKQIAQRSKFDGAVSGKALQALGNMLECKNGCCSAENMLATTRKPEMKLGVLYGCFDDYVSALMSLHEATRKMKFELIHACEKQLLQLLVLMGHPNYARVLLSQKVLLLHQSSPEQRHFFERLVVANQSGVEDKAQGTDCLHEEKIRNVVRGLHSSDSPAAWNNAVQRANKRLLEASALRIALGMQTDDSRRRQRATLDVTADVTAVVKALQPHTLVAGEPQTLAGVKLGTDATQLASLGENRVKKLLKKYVTSEGKHSNVFGPKFDKSLTAKPDLIDQDSKTEVEAKMAAQKKRRGRKRQRVSRADEGNAVDRDDESEDEPEHSDEEESDDEYLGESEGSDSEQIAAEYQHEAEDLDFDLHEIQEVMRRSATEARRTKKARSSSEPAPE